MAINSEIDHWMLLSNINLLHTTKLGEKRIKCNINYNKDKVIEYLKSIIMRKESVVYKKGKNYYCEIDNLIITINSYNYCVITAHLIDKYGEV